MALLISTVVGLGFMSLGLPQFNAVMHDLDMLAKHREEQKAKAQNNQQVQNP